MRNHNFAIGEYYHIYNRGTEKRHIILDEYDLHRFLESIKEFNNPEPIGSIFEHSFVKNKLGTSTTKPEKLVSIIAYCINPNHFHFLLTPLKEGGIEKFMQKIGGYTRYFNEKYKRNGVLFQGRFKSKHIPKNEYLLHLSTYINMNNRDLLGTPTTKLSKSSLEEYIENKNEICDFKIISEQFRNQKEYFEFALNSWKDTQNKKESIEL